MIISRAFMKVSEGTRTPDRLDHNQELYQLSYAHRGDLNLPSPASRNRTRCPKAQDLADPMATRWAWSGERQSTGPRWPESATPPLPLLRVPTLPLRYRHEGVQDASGPRKGPQAHL